METQYAIPAHDPQRNEPKAPKKMKENYMDFMEKQLNTDEHSQLKVLPTTLLQSAI